jgi:hypothetical protein
VQPEINGICWTRTCSAGCWTEFSMALLIEFTETDYR